MRYLSLFLVSLFFSSPCFASSSAFIGGGVSPCVSDGTFNGKQSGVVGCFTPSGGGNVTGAASSTTHDLSAFADSSGTVLEDSGLLSTNICTLNGTQSITGAKTLTSPTFATQTTYSYATATTVPYLDASKHLVSSAVTPTELGYVSGVTSALQTQLNAKAPLASPTFTGTVTLPSATALTSPALTTPTGFIEFISGMFEAPTDKTYVLIESSPYALTINTLKVETVSGTATLAVKINGTNVTGISALSLSSTPSTGTASAANAVAIGDKVTLVESSSSSPVDFSWILKYTR